MAHCCEDNRPTLNEERIKVLKDRIHADKLQLRRLESKINAASPVADVLSTDMSKRHLPHHKPFPISEQTTLRNNPIFNQERYDAMDTYFQDECHKHPLKRNTCKVHQLFEECQRRIRAAESLVEQASAEVCELCGLPSPTLYDINTASDYAEKYSK